MTVKIYTSPTCRWCRQAKDFLAEQGVTYQELDITSDQTLADEAVRLAGRKALPVIVAADNVMVGFYEDELEDLLDELEPRW